MKLDRQGQQALDGAVAQEAFEADLAEAEGLQWGRHVDVGDLVTFRPLPDLSAVDRLTKVAVESTRDTPLGVKLTVGNPDSGHPLFRSAAIQRALAARVRNLEQEEE